MRDWGLGPNLTVLTETDRRDYNLVLTLAFIGNIPQTFLPIPYCQDNNVKIGFATGDNDEAGVFFRRI